MATVIDAGLLVALASAEPAATEVRRLLSAWAESQEPLHAPVLLRYEVASALRRAVWSGRLDNERLHDSLEAAWAVPLTLHPPDDLRAAVDLAALLGRRRVNDAVYLELADRLRAPLITLDGALQRNAAAHGFDVRLIGAS